MRRICVLTAGQLSTCPRMLKAADALHGAGFDVTVVSSVGMAAWADEADQAVRSRPGRGWKWRVVPWDRARAPLSYFITGLAARASRRLMRLGNVAGNSLAMLGTAHQRITCPLARTAAALDCELIYGGGGALSATAIAAKKRGVPFVLDLEDFHSGESLDGKANELVERIERIVLAKAALLTVGSHAIGEAYREKYGVSSVTIHNVFEVAERTSQQPRPGSGALRLYWFSQTIGPYRGLEDVIKAAGIADCSLELVLRGNSSASYRQLLHELARRTAPKLNLVIVPPGPPDRMVDLATDNDVGLAVEAPIVVNRDLCLTNKVFTYLSAGLAVILTDTRGQRELASSLGPSSFFYPPGDLMALASHFRRLALDRQLLAHAKEDSYEAARSRWHWNHPCESPRLVESIANLYRK